MKRLCPECGKTSEWEMITRPEEFEIKGEIITVENQVLICPECKAEYEDMNSDTDPFNLAYEEYRRRKGMVHPAQIVAFRKKYDLTQKELSELLGFGGVTLSRYENGALQDEAHDQLLQFIIQPTNLLNLVKQKPDIFTLEKRKDILSRLDKEVTTSSLIKDYFRNDKPSIISGNRPFDLEKVINLIKCFTYLNPVVKSKLLKLLFYADFSNFKETGFSITGLNYAHLQFGPVPDQYDYLLASILKIDTALRVDVQQVGDYIGELYVSELPPTPGSFPEETSYVIRKVLNYFQRFTAKDIENFSHKEKGYKETIQGEHISYKYAQDLQINKGEKMSGKNQHVVTTGDGKWGIRGEGNSRLTRITDTQQEAIDIGRGISRNQGSELIIHRPNGQIRDKDSHGHDPYPPKG